MSRGAGSSGFDRSLFRDGYLSPPAALALTLVRLDRPADAWAHSESHLARGLLDTGWSAGSVVLARMGVAAFVVLPFGLRALRGRWHLLRRNAGTEYGRRHDATAQADLVKKREVSPAELVEAPWGEPAPASCDIYVLGGGEDSPQASAAAALIAEGVLHRAVDGGAAVLGICAGFQILGHSFFGPDGAARPGLGLLDRLGVVVGDLELAARGRGRGRSRRGHRGRAVRASSYGRGRSSAPARRRRAELARPRRDRVVPPHVRRAA